MKVAVGTDHAGFALKERMIETIREAGHEVVDCGADRVIPGDDYPDYAERVAESIRDGQAHRGLLICGSGVGASVAANKFPGIRAALCHDTFSAHQGVEDDSMNVLCLKARFSEAERHERRLAKVIGFEKQASRA